jgi:toxin secretion/phage lysis holin
MENVSIYKAAVLSTVGVAGAFISTLFGGWDSALTTLVIFMGADYLAGLVVAAVFHKSGKSEKGTLDSRASWKGLCKKGMMLLIVLIAVRLDLLIGSNYIRDAVIIAFVVNELISIIENAGLMGVPIPSVITKAIDVLQDKG